MRADFTLSSPPFSLSIRAALYGCLKLELHGKERRANKALSSHLEIDLGTTHIEGCARTDLSSSFSFLCNVMWFGLPRNTQRLLRNGLTCDRLLQVEENQQLTQSTYGVVFSEPKLQWSESSAFITTLLLLPDDEFHLLHITFNLFLLLFAVI